MEEVNRTSKRSKKDSASLDPKAVELVMPLHAPGMGPLHRAGLGGLACTLDWIRRERQAGRLDPGALPGGPWDSDPPWRITPSSVTLVIGRENQAAEYLEKLFALAFQLRDGLIFLPGQQGEVPVSLAVLADLQQGLLLTFLQHGKTRNLGTEASVTYDPDQTDGQPVSVSFKPCSSFKHQGLWESLVNKEKLTTKTVDLDGPISPGTAVRHVQYTGQTKADQPVELALPAFFAMVGTLALAVNRGVGVLLVPEVTDLCEFIRIRPEMTPRTAKSLRVANAADAVLQAYIRIRAKTEMQGGISSISTVTFRPVAWASQQKSRVGTLAVELTDDTRMLERFERAMSHLPSRIKVQTEKPAARARANKKGLSDKREAYFVDSVVRGLVADNLARGHPWHHDFARMMTMKDPVDPKKFLRTKVGYEREGLNAMAKDSALFDEAGEKLLVEAVHEAIRGNYGRIREETDGANPKGLSQACKNRMEKFREKLRIDLAGSKTEDQVRFTLMDLFSRSRSRNSTLRDQWTAILPIVRRDWRLARDLGLLALVSYKGQGRDEEMDSTDNS